MEKLLKLILLLALSIPAWAQEQELEQGQSYTYQDKYNRDTPRGSFENFIRACNSRDYETAALHLDLRSIPKSKRKKEGPNLARKLKFIIDRTLDIDEMSLSDDPKGLTKDGLTKTRDILGQITIKNRRYNIFLDRMWGPQANVWKISKSSLKHIEPIYEAVGHSKIEEILPPVFIETEIFSLQLWQIIALFLFFPIAFIFAKLFSRKLLRFVPKIGRSMNLFPESGDLRVLEKPALISMGIILFSIFSLSLNLTLATQETLLATLATIFVITLTWFFLRSVDIFTDIFQEKLEKRDLYAASSMIPLGRRFVKIFLFVMTALALLKVYAVDITALLAGLGVGGIAVALAAQNSLENLFSGVSLITDQPVRVGDLCRFDNQIGRVEDIGLRSTRIRTPERSIISIPNREFSQMKLENLSLRDKILFTTTIGLVYETQPNHLRLILSKLRKLLLSHPKVLQDRRIRVRFVSLGEYSLDIEIFCHINTKKWYEYLAIKEDLMLHIMEIVEENGSSFAFPSRTTYQQTAPGLNNDQVQKAISEFDDLHQKGELPFPDYGKNDYAKLRATLPYPPEGSIGTPRPVGKK